MGETGAYNFCPDGPYFYSAYMGGLLDFETRFPGAIEAAIAGRNVLEWEVVHPVRTYHDEYPSVPSQDLHRSISDFSFRITVAHRTQTSMRLIMR
jgi:hypothetical protein